MRLVVCPSCNVESVKTIWKKIRSADCIHLCSDDAAVHLLPMCQHECIKVVGDLEGSSQAILLCKGLCTGEGVGAKGYHVGGREEEGLVSGGVGWGVG